ncbi:hypothetical protein TNCV_3946421 [Trichonephila clavipes]|nr:hypothetical protein TNCV_3946421 [Trichonephila clavipes]
MSLETSRSQTQASNTKNIRVPDRDEKQKNNDSHECLFDNTVFDHAPRNIEDHTTGHALPLLLHYLINHSPRPTIV